MIEENKAGRIEIPIKTDIYYRGNNKKIIYMGFLFAEEIFRFDISSEGIIARGQSLRIEKYSSWKIAAIRELRFIYRGGKNYNSMELKGDFVFKFIKKMGYTKFDFDFCGNISRFGEICNFYGVNIKND
jgi:hypothetical protein